MSAATAAIAVFVVCVLILIPLALLGYRQSRRAAAVSDADAGQNFLAGMALLFAVLAAPLGILLSHLSLRQISHSGASGARMATVALWIAYGLTVVQLVALLALSL